MNSPTVNQPLPSWSECYHILDEAGLALLDGRFNYQAAVAQLGALSPLVEEEAQERVLAVISFTPEQAEEIFDLALDLFWEDRLTYHGFKQFIASLAAGVAST